MLTGKDLGAALGHAIQLKGVSKKAVADAFGVKPPSVQDWINYGRIGKQHLNRLVSYFSDVVPASYWGIEQPFTAQPENSEGLISPDSVRRDADLKHPSMEIAAQLAETILKAAREGTVNQQGFISLDKSLRAMMASPTSESGTVGEKTKDDESHARKPGRARSRSAS